MRQAAAHPLELLLLGDDMNQARLESGLGVYYAVRRHRKMAGIQLPMDTDEQYVQLLKDWNWNQRQIEAALRANFCCEYCDRDLLATANDYHGFHVDHIWPVSKGGPPDESWNWALACAFCNFTKGKRMLHGTFDPALNRAEAVRAVRQELVVLRETKSSTLKDLRGHFRSELWLRNRPLPASPFNNSEGDSE